METLFMRVIGISMYASSFFKLALAQTDYSISNYTCTHVQTDRQTNRERERERERERRTDRQTERQTETQTEKGERKVIIYEVSR